MKKVLSVRRIAVAAVVGLGTVAAGLLVNPSPAAAASTTVYLWQDINFTGYSVAHYTWDSNFSGETYSGGGAPGLNDSVSSIWNTSDYRECFYRDANFSGLVLTVNAGQQVLWVGAGANDNISSMQPC